MLDSLKDSNLVFKEKTNKKEVEELYFQRGKNSLKNIVSPTQNLSFSQLKIYYEEMNYQVNDNFLLQLGLIMEDGKYNYLAYLLADDNDISIKVATYAGNDSFDLIECEEYGYCCLIKATKNVINKFEQINKTYTKIGYDNRKEVKKFEFVPVKEAITNAFCHTRWERQYPPKFEIFSDHISISSTGGLPLNVSRKDFLKGFSAPIHPELMRVFKDLKLVEQLGTGIVRILKSYSEDVYEFSDNFIRVNFKFNSYNDIVKSPKLVESINNDVVFNNPINDNEIILSNTQKQMLELIRNNNEITQEEIRIKLDIGMRTVARNIKALKDKNIIKRVGANKKGKWVIL